MNKNVARTPKRVIRTFAQTIAKYNLIGEGDRVLLGLSGGKDSLTLAHLLLRLQRRAPFKFEFLAVTIDYGMGEDLSQTLAHCEQFGIPYHIEKTNIFKTAKDHIREGSSFCSYFSRMRRGALYGVCERLDYKTLALAHHLDDAAESFFMSLFYGGKLRSMPPVYRASEHNVKVIRPLIKVREAQLAECAKENGFPIVGDENCPAFAMNVKAPRVRYETKAWLKELEGKRAGLFDQFQHAFETLDVKSFADLRYI
ncbi:MAG: tRNA 2-thiocytidine biosynthesis protein TtcA [Helicobacteraceae bacterium]|jgi:tRNA(Ile)-lysidine synthetase-like protein|nr:tRNA 2-thiocytidine biosynthesis protein TtcA [Helicobacteraceae bacterium]